MANGSKALRVQKGIAILSSIDENLTGAGISTIVGKGDGTAAVANFDGIIGNGVAAPLGLHCGVSVNAPLRDKSWQDSKDATVLPKARLGQFL